MSLGEPRLRLAQGLPRNIYLGTSKVHRAHLGSQRRRRCFYLPLQSLHRFVHPLLSFAHPRLTTRSLSMGERLVARLDAIVHHPILIRGSMSDPICPTISTVSIEQAYRCGAFET